MKKYIIIFLSFLFIACSNLQKIDYCEHKNELFEFITSISDNISNNNFQFLEDNTEKTLVNTKILENIRDIDFTKVNIFISEPVLSTDRVFSIFAINVGDRTLYFEIHFTYKGNGWKILRINERG